MAAMTNTQRDSRLSLELSLTWALFMAREDTSSVFVMPGVIATALGGSKQNGTSGPQPGTNRTSVPQRNHSIGSIHRLHLLQCKKPATVSAASLRLLSSVHPLGLSPLSRACTMSLT